MKHLVFEVRRAGRVESVHLVSLAAVDGSRVHAWGDVDRPVFLRSCAKPFQGLTAMQTGAVDAFGLAPPEVAVMCGSHLGDAEAVAAVASMLKKARLTPSRLQCGVHAPLSGRAQRVLARAGTEPGVLHNNCSGKHSGMLAAAKFMEASLDTYLDPRHPLQRANLATLARLSGTVERRIGVGIDGCSAPTFAVPLRGAARAIARFANEPGTSRRVREAMMAHPAMVGRPCAQVMGAAPGRIVAKVGAEGVYVVGLPGRDAGLALKVHDGSTRPIVPVLHAVLKKLRWLDSDALGRLRAAADPVIRNHAKLSVGDVRVRESR